MAAEGRRGSKTGRESPLAVSARWAFRMMDILRGFIPHHDLCQSLLCTAKMRPPRLQTIWVLRDFWCSLYGFDSWATALTREDGPPL